MSAAEHEVIELEQDYVEVVEKTLRNAKRYSGEHDILEKTRSHSRENVGLNDVRQALEDLETVDELRKISVIEYPGWEEPFDDAYADNGKDIDWKSEAGSTGKMMYNLPRVSSEEIDRKYGSE